MLEVIPFIDIPAPRIPFIGVPIHAFGVLVATGILLGVRQVVKRGQQLGFDPLATSSMTNWGILTGFIVSHIFDVIAYQPAAFFANPRILFDNFSISSFGGFLGALLGVMVWVKRHHAPLLANLDAAAYGGTTGWFFGRLGCFSAHDHPGSPTSFFLGVDFGHIPPGGIRHDLGLYEAIFTLGLVIAFHLLARSPRPAGVYLMLIALLYSPVRFGLDFLRVADQRYLGIGRFEGLTPAQFGTIVVFAAGIVLAFHVARAPSEPAPPPAAPTAASDGQEPPGAIGPAD
ncbi:MAG: hypothetical protein EXR72_21615 [Myxococcales bacterium]|nr:hypothetical protein [Myxococcales bacterium]